MPVFLVPEGERPPTLDQKTRLVKHLAWVQEWYRGQLRGRDTFRLASKTPAAVPAKHGLAFYKQQPEGGAPHYVSELLDKAKLHRFNCPYVFVIVIMNPHEDFPTGGGRPLNGGFNTGGGLVMISSFALDRIPNIQSTLRHELGHAFGLPHVDVYGYDMKTNRSVMSYNPGHHTNGFHDSGTPAGLIPENLRDLARNRRCLEKLTFDPGADVPRGEPMSERLIWLGPMEIPGQPNYAIEVTTDSGQTFNSAAKNIVNKWIRPSQGPAVTFDPGTMWQSAESSTGWVSLDLTFPFPVTLTKLGLHTQHSGQYHASDRARLEVSSDGGFREITAKPLERIDAQIAFPETRGQTWRLHLQAGPSKTVVVRGLRFFSASGEIFPPMVPYDGP